MIEIFGKQIQAAVENNKGEVREQGKVARVGPRYSSYCDDVGLPRGE